MEGSPGEEYSPGEDSGHGHVGTMHLRRPPSPVPTCVSMKSGQSIDLPIRFRAEDVPAGQRTIHLRRPPSPVPTCVSMKSGQSIDLPIRFRAEDVPAGQRTIHLRRPPSPVPTCVSMKSGQSIDLPIRFRAEDVPAGQSAIQDKRPTFPVPTCVSMKSDQSIDLPIRFRADVPAGESPIQHKRPSSPVPSCVSMESGQSIDLPIRFGAGDVPAGQSSMQHKIPSSAVLRCVSMPSDESIDLPIRFGSGDVPAGQSLEMQQAHKSHMLKKFQCLIEGLTHQGNPTLLRQIYTDLYITNGGRYGVNQEHEIRQIERASWREVDYLDGEVNKVRRIESRRETAEDTPVKCSNILKLPSEHRYITQGRGWEVNEEHEIRQIERASQKTAQNRHLHDHVEEDEDSDDYDEDEDSDYLEVIHEEHDVRQIERTSWRNAAQGKPIKCSDIFERLSEEVSQLSYQVKPSSKQVKQISKQVKPIGIVLTKGVAGIGKTVSVQKFILDWAEGTSNQDVDFIFPLPFRELNLMKKKNISLVDLISCFFSDIKDPGVFTSSEHKVMFIFDGLDECRLPLDFRSNPECCDVTKSVRVDVLLTNLIQGNLLPSALVWITTRPAAANLIPPECVNQVTEIRGFNDPQKEEYFRKKLSDESLASRIIAHLKSCRSLYIMCHIPIFSWISATVVERTSGGSGSVEMPRTLTQMYTLFLIIQIRIKNTKYTESDTKYTELEERDEEMIFRLGKLAFQQLEKGNLIFYEEDLRECGIDITEASVYSGVCTQIFREETGLYQGRVFSFVHLSVQEFLAALYVYLCFINRERNMSDSDQQQTSQLSALFRAATLQDLHMTAVDLALQRRNGHLDLFLRFLLGLSLESNQNLLNHLMAQTKNQSQSSEQTVQLVKQGISGQRETARRINYDDDDDDLSGSNRSTNLFYCLHELNQHAVVEHIDRSSETLSVEMLIPGQWETGKFKFKTSEEYLDGFDLQKYITTPEKDQTDLLSPHDVLQKLTPSDVFTSSISAELEFCPLSEKSCSYMASALISNSSRLTHLELGTDRSSSQSSLTVSSSAGCHPDCKPWELRLKEYYLTEEICNLVSALTSHTSALSGEDLKVEEEVERLCSTLSHQDCRLETLRLWSCRLSEKSCSYLASGLTSNASRLTKLTLGIINKDLQDSAVEVLCSALCHPNCKLETLQLYECPLSENSCSQLASALTSYSSSLTQLKLEYVPIPDKSAADPLTALQNDPCYQIKMQISFYGLTWRLHLSCRVLEDSEHYPEHSQEIGNVPAGTLNPLAPAVGHHQQPLVWNPVTFGPVPSAAWAPVQNPPQPGVQSGHPPATQN